MLRALCGAVLAAILLATASCGRHSAPEARSAGKARAEKATSVEAIGRAAVAGKPAGRRAAEAEKDKARQVAAEQIPVEVEPVTRGPISASLTFNSTLETEAQVDLFPQTTGQVEELLAEEGQVVKAGAPLLKIEDRELRVEVDESTAHFQHLANNFARTSDLFQRNLINKQDYETQSYQLEQARLRLERAKIRLSYATVRAPFDGVIASRDTQVGARVASNTKVFSIVKLDEIVARVFVPGRYLPVVALEQPALIASEFLPDRTFQGWVKRISPVIDPKSGTFKVTVGVRADNPSDLPPGLFVGVRIVTDTRESAVLVPKRAVVYEGGERYVFTVADGRATKHKLVPGYEDPQSIESLSGIVVGASVIVLGHNGLKDGAAVRIVNALEPLAAPATDDAAAKADASAEGSAAAAKS